MVYCEILYSHHTGGAADQRRGAYQILVVNPEGKRPVGRPRRRWEDNIKIDRQEIGWSHELD
jgi:hypothetical protein